MIGDVWGMLQGHVGVLLDLNKKNPKNADSKREFQVKKNGTPLEVEPASSPLKDFETSPKVKDHLPDSHHGFQGQTFSLFIFEVCGG